MLQEKENKLRIPEDRIEIQECVSKGTTFPVVHTDFISALLSDSKFATAAALDISFVHPQDANLPRALPDQPDPEEQLASAANA